MGICVISSKIVVELEFCMKVQEEIMRLEEEFVLTKKWATHDWKCHFLCTI